jgi:hypothetical protein
MRVFFWCLHQHPAMHGLIQASLPGADFLLGNAASQRLVSIELLSRRPQTSERAWRIELRAPCPALLQIFLIEPHCLASPKKK